IVINKTHRGFVPAWLADQAPFQSRRHHIVTVLENVRFHREIVARDSLDRISAAVDQRPQIFDYRGRKGPSHGPSINANLSGCERRNRARQRSTMSGREIKRALE